MRWTNSADSRWQKWWDTLLISMTLFFLIPPFLAIIVDGLNLTLLDVLQQPGLWLAGINSIFIAISAGILCIILTMMLLWSSRELRLRHSILLYLTFKLSRLLILDLLAL